jgi:hypothetical protein
MPELMATVTAIHESEKRRNTFMAALQGISLDENTEQKGESKALPTAEEIQARAVARITGDATLAGSIAQGFSPEMGMNYVISSEGTEIG